jgi:aspartyl-tRNA(Asn)/glutamyl-tRNA(Gln) amidotransferase subunit A
MSPYRELGVEEYRSSDGVTLGRRVAAGEISPVQLAELAIALAKQAEPALNAYVGFREDAALAEAAALEAEVRGGHVRSALHGVPIASKDNMYLAGEPAMKGSRTTHADPAAVSSPFVDRLVAAGAVIIGRTTTPEFGWKGTGISPLTGVTRNPWDPSKNSGGSSAGSGSTVGSGAVSIATGSDAGGSIRIPAAFCGAVGYKPTLSAIPLWPGTVNESLSHVGPITRSVADAAAVLALTRGPDARDPQSAFAVPSPRPMPARPRIGIVRTPWGIAPSEEIATRTEPAFAAIAAAGIGEVEEIDLDLAVPRSIFEALWVTGRGLGFADLIAEQGAIMDPGLARLLPLAEAYSLRDFLRALQARRAFNSAMYALLERFDVLVMPTMPLVAFEAEHEVPVGGEADAPLPWITWTPYTYPFNVTGQPAITLPFGLTEDALPIGLQLVAGWARDDLLLSVALAAEQALAPLGDLRVAPLR